MPIPPRFLGHFFSKHLAAENGLTITIFENFACHLASINSRIVVINYTRVMSSLRPILLQSGTPLFGRSLTFNNFLLVKQN